MISLQEPSERLLWVTRPTHVVGAFLDGQSALNLAAARLRHVRATRLRLDSDVGDVWQNASRIYPGTELAF
jgi:hypothetical protein